MTSSSDSDEGHRAVKKNGHDQSQDREIRDLKKEFREFCKQDIGSHQRLHESIESVDHKLGKYVFAGRIIWAVIGVAIVGLGSLLGWMTSEIGSHDDKIQEINAGQRATERQDEGLDRRLIDAQQDLRDLRRLVSEHQRNKDEHIQRKNGDR